MALPPIDDSGSFEPTVQTNMVAEKLKSSATASTQTTRSKSTISGAVEVRLAAAGAPQFSSVAPSSILFSKATLRRRPNRLNHAALASPHLQRSLRYSAAAGRLRPTANRMQRTRKRSQLNHVLLAEMESCPDPWNIVHVGNGRQVSLHVASPRHIPDMTVPVAQAASLADVYYSSSPCSINTDSSACPSSCIFSDGKRSPVSSLRVSLITMPSVRMSRRVFRQNSRLSVKSANLPVSSPPLPTPKSKKPGKDTQSSKDIAQIMMWLEEKDTADCEWADGKVAPNTPVCPSVNLSSTHCPKKANTMDNCGNAVAGKPQRAHHQDAVGSRLMMRNIWDVIRSRRSSKATDSGANKTGAPAGCSPKTTFLQKTQERSSRDDAQPVPASAQCATPLKSHNCSSHHPSCTSSTSNLAKTVKHQSKKVKTGARCNNVSSPSGTARPRHVMPSSVLAPQRQMLIGQIPPVHSSSQKRNKQPPPDITSAPLPRKSSLPN